MLGDWTVHEDGGGGPQGAERPVQTPGRHHNEPVDLPRQGLRGPHLLVRMLSGVDQQHLEIALSGRTLHRAHQRCEVWVGDVGDDDGDIAGAASDQAARGTIRHKTELTYGRLDPQPGLGCNLLRDVDGPRHGGRVHAGVRRNIENGRSLLAPHDLGPYPAATAFPEGR